MWKRSTRGQQISNPIHYLVYTTNRKQSKWHIQKEMELYYIHHFISQSKIYMKRFHCHEVW